MSKARKGNLEVCKADTDKVLLVEGTNDCHVVMALCQAHNVPETFGIYACGSDDDVLKLLNARLRRSNPPQTIGVMLDVDQTSIKIRWESIRSKLRDNNHDYTLPDMPNANGTIVSSSSEQPTLGFWLMPNNQDPGMLEDFCAELAEPTAFAFAQDCVAQAQAQQLTTFPAVHHSKAVIHTYLAWQKKPGSPLGQAITQQALRPRTELAQQFTNWLTQLFV